MQTDKCRICKHLWYKRRTGIYISTKKKAIQNEFKIRSWLNCQHTNFLFSSHLSSPIWDPAVSSNMYYLQPLNWQRLRQSCFIFPCYIHYKKVWLPQPYFGHLSYIPFVCVSRKVQGMLTI